MMRKKQRAHRSITSDGSKKSHKGDQVKRDEISIPASTAFKSSKGNPSMTDPPFTMKASSFKQAEPNCFAHSQDSKPPAMHTIQGAAEILSLVRPIAAQNELSTCDRDHNHKNVHIDAESDKDESCVAL